MKPGSFKFSLGAQNEALAVSMSIKSTFWNLKLSSGSTPVDESNVFGCPEGFKRRGPGAYLGASSDKSIKSDEEMKDFRDELQNEACDLEIQSGSSK